MQKLLITVVRPMLVAMRAVLRPVYRLLVGPFDQRAAKKNRITLESDVKKWLPFLFNEYRGEIVADIDIRFPPPFDYAVLTVSLQDIFLRFISGRGELDIRVRYESDPGKWSELLDVLAAIGKDVNPARISYFAGAADVIRKHLPEIIRAFSPETYQETKERLSNIHSYNVAVTKQLQTEINRKLYE